MANKSPKISIVTPVFNRAHVIGHAIETVQAQTVSDWEMIIVDDCSTDEIKAAIAPISAADPRIRLIRRETNGGPSGARNTGVDAASGDFIAFLDSDDHWAPEKLDQQLAAVESLPDQSAAFCVTKTNVVYGDGRGDQVLPERGVTEGERWGTFLYVANQFAQCSSFFLSAALAARISFDETLRQYEDHLYFLAAGGAGGQYVLVDAPLVTWQNDARADRMGATDSTERGAAFLARAGALLTETEALAFQVRCLGPTLAHQSRGKALRLAMKARTDAGLPREAWVKLMAQGLIGPGGYNRLRSLLSRG